MATTMFAVALESRADARRKGRAWIIVAERNRERHIFYTHTHTHTHTLCQTPSYVVYMCRFFSISQNAPKTLDCSTLFLKNSSSNSKKHSTRRTITSRASSHSYVSTTRDNNEEEQQEAHTRWRLNSRTSRSPNSRKRSLCSIKMATGPSRRKSSVR